MHVRGGDGGGVAETLGGVGVWRGGAEVGTVGEEKGTVEAWGGEEVLGDKVLDEDGVGGGGAGPGHFCCGEERRGNRGGVEDVRMGEGGTGRGYVIVW